MTQPDPPPAVDVCYLPDIVDLPDGDALAAYLSLDNPSTDLVTALNDVAVIAADYQLARLSCALMVADGAVPPNTVPSPVARAILMYAAALWRRRNSVNGFDGYDDLGTVPVRGTDPNVEQLLDRWRAWCYA